MMPWKYALKLRELQLLSIELRNDFRAPMFRDLREFIGKIYGIHIFCLTKRPGTRYRVRPSASG